MLKSVKIYLCGSIKKGSGDIAQRNYWGNEEEQAILTAFGSEYEITLLNPATAGLKRTDSFSNFGGDMFLVKTSNFIFVDARDRRGIGIGGEMFAAKYFGLPVVSLCPVGSHYRKEFVKDLCGEDVSNWVHPFITGLSDFLADTIEDAVEWMMEFSKQPVPIKGMEIIGEAIEHFLKSQSIWEASPVK